MIKPASIAAIALLAGCGMTGPSTSSGVTPSGLGLTPFMRARSVDPTLRPQTAWMSPESKSQSLMYESDYYGDDVYVFTYPQLKQVGLLTGFSFPSGLCVDKNANVWIADEFNSQLVEYAHGAKTPTTELSDKGWYPVGCSFDSNSGSLAVSNIAGTASTPGSVSVYKNATGKPAVHRDPDIAAVFFLSYDDHGTIWLDGETAEQQFAYASLKGSTFTNITLSGATIQHPGDVDFIDGKITVGDQQGSGGYSIVYQTSGSQILGSTDLIGSSDVSQYVVAGKRLVGVDAINDAVEIWNYPAGGTMQRAVDAPWTTPNGIAISPDS